MTQLLFKPRSSLFDNKPLTKTLLGVSVTTGIVFLCVFIHLSLGGHLLQIRERRSVIVEDNSISAPESGQFSPILFDQGISHDQFHTQGTKLRLAELFRKHSRAAIVGVASGGDCVFFAHEGYEIYAFDPMTNSIRTMMKWAKSIKVDKQIHSYRVAAGEKSGGEVKAEYLTGDNQQREIAKRARIDDYIKEPLDVLSLDIQGGEWDVLRGAMKIVEGPGVRSMWIEIHGCNEKVPPMLKALDKLDYALFDMVPVGATKATKVRESLFDSPNSYAKGWRRRPSSYKKYFKWMCHLQKHEWKWIQSDILAVKRELLTEEILLNLRSLGADVIKYYEVRGRLKLKS